MFGMDLLDIIMVLVIVLLVRLAGRWYTGSIISDTGFKEIKVGIQAILLGAAFFWWSNDHLGNLNDKGKFAMHMVSLSFCLAGVEFLILGLSVAINQTKKRG
jgi:hypothetical protein